MKRFLSVLMSVIMIVNILLPISVFSETADDNAYPIVYVVGQASGINDAQGNRIYGLTVPDGYIADQVKGALPYLAKALVTDKWDEYSDYFYNAVAPIFSKIVLNNDGEVTDGSVVSWGWTENEMQDRRLSDGTYDINSYVFYYDWRLDPFATAEKINDYIETVKRVTGSDKVNLCGRCLGANIVLTYLSVYGDESINSVVLRASTALGTYNCGKPFSGKLNIDGDSLERFVGQGSITGDVIIDEFLSATVALLNKTYGIEAAKSIFNLIYSKIHDTLVPRLIFATYGSFPAYWSMVGEEDYEDAKAFVLGDDAKYAKLIEKIDNYHYNVQAKATEIINKTIADGVDVAIICKYGRQLVPVYEKCEYQSDDTVELIRASFGATCSAIDGTFSDEYIENAKANGTYKYISGCKQVDASTCLLPDKTWFIKDLEHINFPVCVDKLVVEFMNSNGSMTINSDPQYPQFLKFDAATGTISPVTEETITKTGSHGYLVTFIEFIKAIFKLFSKLIKSV